MGMGRGEERVRCMERVHVETYIAIYKTDSQWEFAVWLINSNRGSVSTWAGGMGREVQQEGDICIPMADSC